jgi:5-methylthioadenosine/S-adenosylhomocysteine deaminase
MYVDCLIQGKWVIPVQPAGVLENHSIAIHAGRIVGILPHEQAIKRYKTDNIINCQQHALLPGFINSHTHAAMNLLKGIADDLPLSTWLEDHIWPAEARWLSESFIHDGSLLAIAEMLRGGTTTFNDMYLFPEVTARCAQLSGIRAAIGLVVLDFPTPWAQNADEYLSKGLALRDELDAESLISVALAPHAPYTVSDAPLKRIATLANELDIPVHIHVHETADEITTAINMGGQRPIERLNKLGLLTPNLQAVHLTQVNTDEIEQLAENRVNVVHCPESNLKLASGICPVNSLINAGINLAIGTDGAASNNDLDMLGEMRSAALLAKGFSGDATALSTQQALEMATINGARTLGIEEETGSLEKGKAADIIAIKLDSLETQPVYDPLSSLVYSCSRESVEHVWVAGRQLLKDRHLITLDESELLENASSWQKKISGINTRS